MPALILRVESRENLASPVTETLTLRSAELTAEQLITLRVMHRTAQLPPEDQRKAVEQALDAFRHDLYLLIVNGRRVESLDERLSFREDTQVRFWRLVPLAGGST